MRHSREPRPRIRILIGEATALGPGKVNLLAAIIETGSISGAARKIGMSYRRAWQLVNSMNHSFTGDLVTTVTGGAGGGGATVTKLGSEVIKQYKKMESRAEASVRNEALAFSRLLARPGDDT